MFRLHHDRQHSCPPKKQKKENNESSRHLMSRLNSPPVGNTTASRPIAIRNPFIKPLCAVIETTIQKKKEKRSSSGTTSTPRHRWAPTAFRNITAFKNTIQNNFRPHSNLLPRFPNARLPKPVFIIHPRLDLKRRKPRHDPRNVLPFIAGMHSVLLSAILRVLLSLLLLLI